MKGSHHFQLLFCFALFSLVTMGQGYKIKVQVNGLADKQVILGHYMSKSMLPDDTVKLNSKGVGVLEGKKELPKGMYIIYLPNTTYFDLIIGDDQNFSVKTDTANFVKTMVIEGSVENQVFLDFQNYMIVLNKKVDSLTKMIKAENDVKILENLRAQLKDIFNSRVQRIDDISKQYPKSFIASFLKASSDVTVPDPPKDEKGNVIDSTWQYFYYRMHYFDNFNIADPRLLRTPFYEDKIMTYLNKVIPQIPDSIIPQVDYLIDKSKADSNTFKFVMITLYNYYGKSNIMGMDAVNIHIAEKYYINEAWWSDQKFITDLKARVEKQKPLLIGATAPDVQLMIVPASHFVSAVTDTALRRYPHVGTKTDLSQIQAKYLVLIFWEADCGHCKVAVPKLYDIYEKTLKDLDVKVLAISTLFGEDGKIKWVDFVNKNHLYDWINAWNPYSYDFKMRYDIVTTPQIFILDENKKILAKRINPEQVEEIIKSFSKR
jgi:hypothetical protein